MSGSYSYSGNPSYYLQKAQTPAATPLAAPSFTDTDDLTRRRKMADALYEQSVGNDAPIRSPLQGVARLATRFLRYRQADKADAAVTSANASNRDALAKILGGGNVDPTVIANLLTSPDETAQKVGSTYLQSNLKHQQSLDDLKAKQYHPATDSEKTTYGFKPTDQVTMSPEGEPKQLNLRLPMGWTQDAGGNFIPVPGGPADPAYLKSKSDAERKPAKPTATDGYVPPAPWGKF